MDSTEVRLARIEERLTDLIGEVRGYHKDVVKPIAVKVDAHHDSLTILKRDRWWISSLAGVVFSWLGLKLFGKG